MAAGLGTRMGELTKDTPKALLKVRDRSILEETLASLPDEIDEVVIVVGYLGDRIREALGPVFLERKITYVEQNELKGTGHALMQAKDVLRGRFLVLMGDDLYAKKDLEEMLKHPLSILVREMDYDDPADSSGLVSADSSGNLADIRERVPKKRGDLVNCAAYVLDERYFALPLKLAGDRSKEYGLPQTMIQLIDSGARFQAVKARFWRKITSPEDLA